MGRRATGTVEPLKGSIRLKFTVAGARCVEPLALKPTPANIKAAERLLAQVQQAIDRGVYSREDFFEAKPDAPTSNPTVSEYAVEWLKTWAGASSTKRTYETAFRATWNPHFGDTKLAKLKASDIRKAIAVRKDEIAAGTLNNQLSAL